MNATVEHIARTLGETEADPIQQIERVVDVLGDDAALAYLEQTLAVEAEGGMTTHDGTRRRTPGGTFFFLVRGGITWSQRRRIFPGDRLAHRNTRPRSSDVESYEWDNRETDFRAFAPRDRGEGKVELKIIGRPLKVVEKPQLTILTMRSGNPPTLPAGLPKPPDAPTIYLVFIAAKQWRKVKDALDNPENKLIIKGWPVYDGKLGTITVLAQSTTSVMQEKARQARPSDTA